MIRTCQRGWIVWELFRDSFNLLLDVNKSMLIINGNYELIRLYAIG